MFAEELRELLKEKPSEKTYRELIIDQNKRVVLDENELLTPEGAKETIHEYQQKIAPYTNRLIDITNAEDRCILLPLEREFAIVNETYMLRIKIVENSPDNVNKYNMTFQLVLTPGIFARTIKDVPQVRTVLLKKAGYEKNDEAMILRAEKWIGSVAALFSEKRPPLSFNLVSNPLPYPSIFNGTVSKRIPNDFRFYLENGYVMEEYFLKKSS